MSLQHNGSAVDGCPGGSGCFGPCWYLLGTSRNRRCRAIREFSGLALSSGQPGARDGGGAHDEHEDEEDSAEVDLDLPWPEADHQLHSGPAEDHSKGQATDRAQEPLQRSPLSSRLVWRHSTPFPAPGRPEAPEVSRPPQRSVGLATASHRPDGGAGEPAGVVGSRVDVDHHAVMRSALDAARRRAESGAQGRRRQVALRHDVSMWPWRRDDERSKLAARLAMPANDAPDVE